jgi:hypothetical protein
MSCALGSVCWTKGGMERGAGADCRPEQTRGVAGRLRGGRDSPGRPEEGPTAGQLGRGREDFQLSSKWLECLGADTRWCSLFAALTALVS